VSASVPVPLQLSVIVSFSFLLIIGIIVGFIKELVVFASLSYLWTLIALQA
jgi:hypothetical protein